MRKRVRFALSFALSVAMVMGMCPTQGFADEDIVVEVATDGDEQDVQLQDQAKDEVGDETGNEAAVAEEEALLQPQYENVVTVTIEEDGKAPQTVESSDLVLALALLNAQQAVNRKVTLTINQDIYLDKHENLDTDFKIRQGRVTIDLNGHTVDMGGNNLLLRYSPTDYNNLDSEIYTTFTIKDSRGGGKLDNCKILAGSSDYQNHGRIDNVDVDFYADPAILIIDGGTINGDIRVGDAIDNYPGYYGRVNLLNGTINGDVTIQTSHRNYDPLESSLTMSGGVINGSVTTKSDYDSCPVRFTMTGGTITNAKGLGVNVDENSAFTMSGGAIEGCTGGGVNVGVSGTFELSGDDGASTILGNTANGQTQNVFLPENKTITVIDPLADGTSIGVTTETAPTEQVSVPFTDGFNTQNPEGTPSQFFASDDANCYVAKNAGGEGTLTLHQHNWECAAEGNVLTAACKNSNCVAEGGNVQTLTLLAQGKAYDGKPVAATVQKSAGWTATGAVTESVAYYEGNKRMGAAPVDAGSYEARLTVQIAGDKQTVSAPFSITKVPLTITAKNNAVVFGKAPAGAGVTYAGFIGGEGGEVLSGTLTYDFGGCKAGSPMGTYAITPSGLSSSNYDITYKAGTLTVHAPDTCSVTAVAYMQKKGTMRAVTGVGKVVGAAGKGRRLESLRLRLSKKPLSGGIEYRAYVQKNGWQAWKSNGAMVGTKGKSRRMEAIQIRLTGRMAECYNVYYRVYVQHYGWMAWAKNGAKAGTKGKSRRIEAVQVVVVRKGSRAPGKNYNGVKQNYRKAFVKK